MNGGLEERLELRRRCVEDVSSYWLTLSKKWVFEIERGRTRWHSKKGLALEEAMDLFLVYPIKRKRLSFLLCCERT